MEEGNWIYIKRRRRRVRWTERKRQRRRGWQELGASSKGSFFLWTEKENEKESQRNLWVKSKLQSFFPSGSFVFVLTKKKKGKKEEERKWSELYCTFLDRIFLHCEHESYQNECPVFFPLVSVVWFNAKRVSLYTVHWFHCFYTSLPSFLFWTSFSSLSSCFRLRLLSFPFSAYNTEPGGCCCDAEK